MQPLVVTKVEKLRWLSPDVNQGGDFPLAQLVEGPRMIQLDGLYVNIETLKEICRRQCVIALWRAEVDFLALQIVDGLNVASSEDLNRLVVQCGDVLQIGLDARIGWVVPD